MNQGPATYLTYLDNQRAFEAIGAWESNQVSITGRGEPEQVEALAVTHTTLGVLRVQPLLGRFFSREDDTPGGPPRAVLSYGYWQRRFGGARNVIGQLLEVDGTPSEVIGVLWEDNGNPLFVEHLAVAEGQLPPLRRFKSFAPGYFETMGNRLVAYVMGCR